MPQDRAPLVVSAMLNAPEDFEKFAAVVRRGGRIVAGPATVARLRRACLLAGVPLAPLRLSSNPWVPEGTLIAVDPEAERIRLIERPIR